MSSRVISTADLCYAEVTAGKNVNTAVTQNEALSRMLTPLKKYSPQTLPNLTVYAQC